MRTVMPLLELAVAVTILSSFVGPAEACPLGSLAQLAAGPLATLDREELPARVWQSTEGGGWEVFRRGDGAVHSIRRTDYGETGRREAIASFVTLRDFTIVETMYEYREPIYQNSSAEIARITSRQYFFCDGVAYLPQVTRDEGGPAAAQREADELRSVFFDAEELTPYLAELSGAE